MDICFVDMYYICQMFLISYYTNYNTQFLIITFFLIHSSSKIPNNLIIKYIYNNIFEFNVLLQYFNIYYMLYLLHFTNNVIKLQFYFFVNLMSYLLTNSIFDNNITTKQYFSEIIYLSICMIWLI